MPVDGFKVRDGHHPQTGDQALALEDATAVSCNIYFAHTGLNIGGDAVPGLGRAPRLRRADPLRRADGGQHARRRRWLRRRRGAGQCRLRAGPDPGDAAPDGARGGDHRRAWLAHGAARRRRAARRRWVGRSRRAEPLAPGPRSRPRGVDRPGHASGRGGPARPAVRRQGQDPGRAHGRQERHGRAGRQRASPTAGSSASRRPATRPSRSRSSSRVAAPAARRPCRMGGQLMGAWLDLAALIVAGGVRRRHDGLDGLAYHRGPRRGDGAPHRWGGRPPMPIQEAGEKVIANVERVIVGKHEEVRLALVALLCQGHLLIEDVPGHRQDRAGQGHRAEPGLLASGASSSRRTCCPRT